MILKECKTSKKLEESGMGKGIQRKNNNESGTSLLCKQSFAEYPAVLISTKVIRVCKLKGREL